MKDLFDAIKEAYSQNEPTPADGGWQAVSASMHKASVRRVIAWTGGAIAACAAGLLIVAGISGSGADAVFSPAPVQNIPVQPLLAQAIAASEADGALTDHTFTDGSDSPAPIVRGLASAAEGVVSDRTGSQDSGASPECTDPQDADAVIGLTDSQDVSAVPFKDVEPGTGNESGLGMDRLPDNWPEKKILPKRRLRATLGVNASASPISGPSSSAIAPQLEYLAMVKSNDSGVDFVSNINTFLLNYCSSRTDISYKHDIPLGFGLVVNFPLTERISLETGMCYSYLHSVEANGEVLSEQKLHFVGIPVRASYSLLQSRRFSLYAGAGGVGEKCLKASVGGLAYDEKRLQWAGEAFLGAEYMLGKSTSLYLQPKLSYWFTQTDLLTYRTENPLVFSLDAGLRFHL